MENYTLSYSETHKGWTSFLSFIPEYMIGMNNKFFSFKGGNIYIHNTNELRNNFYGVQYKSTIKTVLNDLPTQNKLFKTLHLEGDSAWAAILTTDIQNTGTIEKSWFEKKEGSWYAYVRNSGAIPAETTEYVLRSLNGIGITSTITPIDPSRTVSFPVSPLVDIGTIVSVGDYLYAAQAPYTTPKYAGVIMQINKDYRNGVNSIVINTIGDDVVTIPSGESYYMYAKNAIAESHGVLGHYCVVELENDSTSAVELFTIESQIMKSYP